MRHWGQGQGGGLLTSKLEKLNLFRLTSLISGAIDVNRWVCS